MMFALGYLSAAGAGGRRSAPAAEQRGREPAVRYWDGGGGAEVYVVGNNVLISNL